MGAFSEYIGKPMPGPLLEAERKKQLKRIATLRQRDVIVFAADLTNARHPIQINYGDLLPFNDQLSNLTGTDAIDVILETPGGSGEVVEDLVRLLRGKYQTVGVIVPGAAKSAGTLFTMAADEILMEPVSSLGPTDAQITWQGKTFSAHALLEGMEKIKVEVKNTGALNRAYIPILQNLTPGDLQHAENAYNLAKELVADWLARYKFKDWHVHSSTGEPVTPDERQERARQIASQLCDQNRWKTHGRSIKMADLRAMKLQITDYTETPELCDAIRRYHTLLRLTFGETFKVFETPTSQVTQNTSAKSAAVPAGPTQSIEGAGVNVECPNCSTKTRLFAPLRKGASVPPGVKLFPANNTFTCPKCRFVQNLSQQRQRIEQQLKRAIVS